MVVHFARAVQYRDYLADAVVLATAYFEPPGQVHVRAEAGSMAT
jgi:hypothetical protein